MKEKDVILLLDSDAERGAETVRLLGEHYDCAVVDTVTEAHNAQARKPAAVIVVREHESATHSAALCRTLHQRCPEIKIVLVASQADCRPLIDAFNENCLFRCLFEPVAPAALTSTVRAAVRRHEMERVQSLLVQRAEEIDRQIHSAPYWLYRLRTSIDTFVRMIAGSVGFCIIAGIVVLMAGIGIFLLLYYIKSALGIDLFKDKHLTDFLPL